MSIVLANEHTWPDAWVPVEALPASWEYLFLMTLPKSCQMTHPGGRMVRSPWRGLSLADLVEVAEAKRGWRLPHLDWTELRAARPQLSEFEDELLRVLELPPAALEAELVLAGLLDKREANSGPVGCTAFLRNKQRLCGRPAVWPSQQCRMHGGTR